MKPIDTSTKIIIASAACILGFAVGLAAPAPRALAPEPQPDPAIAQVEAAAEAGAEELVISEPIYIVVDRAPGAPMATGDLAVQSITIDEPTRVQVYRTPQGAVANAEPHGTQGDLQ